MSGSNTELVEEILRSSVAAEQTSEIKYRGFAAAAVGDDEVRRVFEDTADSSKLRCERLRAQLPQTDPSTPSPGSDFTLDLGATSMQLPKPRAEEEHLLHILLDACMTGAGQCVVYKVLEAVSKSAGDSLTERLAIEFQQQQQTAGEQIWHFIPTRSKIAFNMLTVSELDPAVETKLRDDLPGS